MYKPIRQPGQDCSKLRLALSKAERNIATRQGYKRVHRAVCISFV